MLRPFSAAKVTPDPQLLGQEREVTADQLVLQRLGRGGDDRLAAGDDSGHEVAEALAGARPRLDDEVPAPGDGARDGLDHGRLSGSRLAAAGQGGHDPGQLGSDVHASDRTGGVCRD